MDKETKKYTREEISTNINILKNQEDSLLRERKELNRFIREKRANIKEWEEMSTNQYKMF